MYIGKEYVIRNLFITYSIVFKWTNAYLEDSSQCQPIRIEMCSHLKYNMTQMPNFLGHATQDEAIRELTAYSQLVNFFNCSQHLKFFLCSLFAPMCTQQMDGPLVIEVCRSMCLQVKSDCEPMLANLKIPWPLNCSRLPESNMKEQLCMAPETITVKEASVRSSVASSSKTTLATVIPLNKAEAEKLVTKSMPDSCPSRYVKYDNTTCTDLCDPSCQDCVPTCSDVYFTKQHKSFAYTWIAVWSSLCIISTLFTLVVFCIEPNRFRYPTRPIMFMAFCYLMYSLTYFVRLFISIEDISCKADTDGNLVYIVNKMESTLCILIFLIQYYFGIASHIWWLVMTLTWYLAASRKWGLEAISSIACYFHLFAWAIPAVLTIAILVTGRVDSNELTGMCYVGNHHKWSLLIYVIIPLSFMLLFGEIFLLAGFAALLRIRSNLKSQIDYSNIRKLEKLMAKIGIFAILYTVSTVCMLGSYVYESLNMEVWRCLSSNLPGNEELTYSLPTVEIHMLKLFMSFVIGITLAMWVVSSKTMRSCEQKCCHRSRRTPSLRFNYNQPSYVVAKPMDANGCIQHYKFPRQHYISSRHTNDCRNLDSSNVL